MSLRVIACSLVLLVSACGSSHSPDDGGGGGMDGGPSSTEAGVSRDSGPIGSDAGVLDAGSVDAATDDAGELPICTAEMACTDGRVCTGGPGCGAAWTCVATGIGCTDDLAQYCGCDGRVFEDSGSCPTRPFAHRGPCAGADGFECDRSLVTCRALEPECAPGEVAEVMGSCWTFRCVPLTECGCREGGECPGDATCDSGAMRCQAAP